jgi:hypothetical protein
VVVVTAPVEEADGTEEDIVILEVLEEVLDMYIHLLLIQTILIILS